MPKQVRAKKFLGQHFLKDESVAEQTANLVGRNSVKNWLEIGPGMGVLTKYLIEKPIELKAVELDRDSVTYLEKEMPTLEVHEADFLKIDVGALFDNEYGVIETFRTIYRLKYYSKFLTTDWLFLHLLECFNWRWLNALQANPIIKHMAYCLFWYKRFTTSP